MCGDDRLGARAFGAAAGAGIRSDVVRLVDVLDLHDVPLAGHSYCWQIVTSVAICVAGGSRSASYLDAFVGENGETTTVPQKRRQADRTLGKDTTGHGGSVARRTNRLVGR